LEHDYSKRLHASQFLTEIQGGSDVGANTTRAVQKDEKLFSITGEKWFCSVIDAGLFVLTARFPGGNEGTKGLGLFLVPRFFENRLNNFSVRRLKNKLGTRSMATGEADFHGAIAEAIGPLEQGFANAVKIILDTSRMYNAVAACGMMRRALIEALTYSNYRQAFGKKIVEYPLVRHKLARMKVDSSAANACTFRILDMTDRIDLNEADLDLQTARRICVTINKYWTSIKCTESVHSAIEVLGGNGTIEDFSVLPRLYRDAIVLESWEGSHNVLCLQVLKDFATKGMHELWIRDIRSVLSKLKHPSNSRHLQRAVSFTDDVSRMIRELLEMGEPQSAYQIRNVVDQMNTLNGYVSLLREVDWELDRSETGLTKSAIVDLYRLYYVDRDQEDQRAALEQKVCSL
jgi:alkylation response protein AidB-like acyl-CoA dehydrogenase